MLTTLLVSVIILFACVFLLAIKVIFKKDGSFPNTHIDGNSALRKKGIYCAKTQHLQEIRKRNLYDRINK